MQRRKATRKKAATRKAAAKKPAAKKPEPASKKRRSGSKPAKPVAAPAPELKPELKPELEPERDKATGAIEYGREVQEHTGPENPNAERTIRSRQRFTNSMLPKGPWHEYAGRPDTGFAGTTRRAARISGLFVCVAADGTETACEDGYVICDEPGRNPEPVPALAFDNNFERVDPGPVKPSKARRDR